MSFLYPKYVFLSLILSVYFHKPRVTTIITVLYILTIFLTLQIMFFIFLSQSYFILLLGLNKACGLFRDYSITAIYWLILLHFRLQLN